MALSVPRKAGFRRVLYVHTLWVCQCQFSSKKGHILTLVLLQMNIHLVKVEIKRVKLRHGAM